MRRFIFFLVFILFFILIVSLLVIRLIGKKVSPSLFKYAEVEVKKFSNLIINDAVNKVVTDKKIVNDIFIISDDKNGEIKSIDFNTPMINKYLTEATKNIQKDIENIEKGNIDNISPWIVKKYNKKNLRKGIIFSLNTGVLSDSPILSNLGPKIPIKINLVGDVVSYVSAEVDDYGINNSIVKVFLNFKVKENVVLPFYGKNIDMEAKVPIAVKMITGKLPEYYLGTREGKSIVIPN